MTRRRREPRQTLGEHLEAARQAAGLSLRQLAGLSGLAMSSVNRLLKDEVDQPSPDNLVALARALELNVTDLFLLAGIPITDHAASLDIMLRKGYGVRDADVPQLRQQIEALIADHVSIPKTKPRGGGTHERKDN